MRNKNELQKKNNEQTKQKLMRTETFFAHGDDNVNV